MSQNHSFAYLTRIPFKGLDIAAGGDDWTACRIVGEISVTYDWRKNLEDEDEEGDLVGELHTDKVTKISLTLGVDENFEVPEKNSVVVVATADEVGTQFNGNWQVDEVSPVFKAGERAEVKVTLRQNENLTLTP